MKRKITALVLCFLMLLSAAPGSVFAAANADGEPGSGDGRGSPGSPSGMVRENDAGDAVSRAAAAWAMYNLAARPATRAGTVPVGDWGLDVVDYSSSAFPDVVGKSYDRVSNWAAEAGLFVGDENGNFSGDRAITRAELVTVLYRYAQYKGLDVSAGEDANLQSYSGASGLPEWSVSAFRWACGAGIVDAAEGLPAPGDTVAAEEFQEMLANFGGSSAAVAAVFGDGTLDMAKWRYNADDDVYYQLGIFYCAAPADTDYENLAIFVPGAYFTAADNGDGTYACAVNAEGKVNGYTAAAAPIVLPVNTPGYSAMAPLTAYTSLTEYMEAGFIYVHAGCRGRDHGAPAGVADLKAAVRYLRRNAERLPGDTGSIFTFGMSGGGGQSALMGATGNSGLYAPYLRAIGALMEEPDDVAGSMCWCPITNLDSADAAYEWMMGATRSDLTEAEQAISDALAEAFAAYVGEAGIMGPDGTALTLDASEDGIYQAGSYYDYIVSEIERSLNNFLADTAFPYDASASSSGGRGGFGGGAGPGDRGQETGGGEKSFEEMDDISRTETAVRIDLSGVYETAQDYVDAMNADSVWVSYDAETNTASITSAADFVKAFKPVSKGLGAFDQLDGGQGENTLFGYADGSGAHFDAMLAAILAEQGSEYAEDYAADLQKTDGQGKTAEYRLNAYSPLYYLLRSSEGYGSSAVAKHWRIRTGIAQSDTAVTTEVNLALALENYDGVEDVDFEMVWGMQHVEAERSGGSTANFIAWVNDCMTK